MAVPVVSEPVPAVVGTKTKLMSRTYVSAFGVFTSNERSQGFGDGQSFANGGIDEVHQISVLVDGEPETFRQHGLGYGEQTYKFAALAVSITEPPPTLRKVRHNHF